MGLDFGNTCPIIDRSLDSIKYDIDYYIAELVADCKNQIPTDSEVELDIDENYYAMKIYDDIKGEIEDLRNVNSEMRDQAEKQITDLEDQVAYAENELNNQVV